jgi:hypothetical protein
MTTKMRGAHMNHITEATIAEMPEPWRVQISALVQISEAKAT